MHRLGRSNLRLREAVFGELHSREKKSKMKEATQVIKSVESHSDDAGHDDDDDENGGGKREAEER
jgi:hypothetical protein